MNKIVARFVDGRIVKGSTSDLLATKQTFHVAVFGTPPGSKPSLVQVNELKALFFVKDLNGRPQHQARQEFDPARPVLGRKIKVIFNDGEILVGTTQGYQPGRPGFFMIPADSDSNIERCFVIATATRVISLLYFPSSFFFRRRTLARAINSVETEQPRRSLESVDSRLDW